MFSQLRHSDTRSRASGRVVAVGLDHGRRNPPSHPAITVLRAGFTLVEMMVAVALVLLMMTMFAEIFSLATGTIGKQKGLAELDQRQRLTATLLRDDLRNRTFKKVFAFHPADTALNSFGPQPIQIPNDQRQGYIYISDNDDENDGDDVLQLTVTRSDGFLFYGRTRELIDAMGNGAGTNPNQPENDDGSFYGEGLGVGTSPTAEVAYFLRNGILYRRVLLIRRPSNALFNEAPSTGYLGVGAGLVQNGIYPQGSGGGTIYVNGATTANRYPEDFDYSATNDFATPPQMTILGESSLTATNPSYIGIRTNRFGFRPTNGQPLEYLNPVTPALFIGRFTHEETSHTDFAWPGNPGWGANAMIGDGDDVNPYTRPAAGLSLTPNSVVTQYAGGPRQGEDILLTNVQCFDVKIWDPGAGAGPDGAYGIAGVDDDGANGVDDAGELGWHSYDPLTQKIIFSDDGAFVDIGYGPNAAPNATAAAGRGFFFARFNNRNQAYGSRDFATLGNINRSFDTWNVSPGSNAPFRPALPGADLQPGVAGVDDDNSDGDNDPATGVDDSLGELGWPGSDDVPILIKAIQIRIRYLDIASNLVREVTIVESLTP